MTTPEAPAEPDSTAPRLALAALAVSVLLGVILSVCYAIRPDACAAVTIIPVWAWIVPGLLLVVPALWGRSRVRGSRLASLGWLAFLLIFAEEPWSAPRAWLAPPPRRASTVRVVSLNCNIGSARAAAEVAAYRPDIVLLQETPSRPAVETLAARLFGAAGSVVHGPEASIIVHGTAAPAALPSRLRSYFVQARVRLASGLEAEVFSTRLVPAALRLDLWSPTCWRAQVENRRKRRTELSAIATRAAALPADLAVIVGGDFNAPQGDAVFRALRPQLRDTFHTAGRGWGNTILNGLPVLRIDQVWTSKDLRALNVVARTTVYSDHRMVVCDLETVSPLTEESRRAHAENAETRRGEK